MLAVQAVAEIWEPDKLKETEQVYKLRFEFAIFGE